MKYGHLEFFFETRDTTTPPALLCGGKACLRSYVSAAQVETEDNIRSSPEVDWKKQVLFFSMFPENIKHCRSHSRPGKHKYKQKRDRDAKNPTGQCNKAATSQTRNNPSIRTETKHLNFEQANSTVRGGFLSQK